MVSNCFYAIPTASNREQQTPQLQLTPQQEPPFLTQDPTPPPLQQPPQVCSKNTTGTPQQEPPFLTQDPTPPTLQQPPQVCSNNTTGTPQQEPPFLTQDPTPPPLFNSHSLATHAIFTTTTPTITLHPRNHCKEEPPPPGTE